MPAALVFTRLWNLDLTVKQYLEIEKASSLQMWGGGFLAPWDLSILFVFLVISRCGY